MGVACGQNANADAEGTEVRSKSNNSCVRVKRIEIKLIEDCKQLMPAGFIFHQDGAPAHTARCTQTVLRSLRRTVGHQILKISLPLTITCGWEGHAEIG